MTLCKVILGPILADRQYHDGETLDLPEADALQLQRWGNIQIIENGPTPTVTDPVALPSDPTPAPPAATTPVAQAAAPVPPKAEVKTEATSDPGSTAATSDKPKPPTK